MYFLEYLNKHRGSGLHIISQECFKKIGLILNLLLDEVYESKDFITAKYCLILSQTYNKQDEITNKKISLQDTIEKNELLRNLYFWEEYISCKFFKHNNKYFPIKNYNLYLYYLIKNSYFTGRSRKQQFKAGRFIYRNRRRKKQ